MKTTNQTAPHPGIPLTWVRQRAMHLQMNMSQLALRAGISRVYLHRLCNGEIANPGLQTLQRLAQALQLPSSALVRLWEGIACTAMAQHVRHISLENSFDILVFVADVTVPDHSAVLPNQRFTKTWAIQNAGTVFWPVRRLVRQDSELVIARRERNGTLVPLLDSHLSSLGTAIEIPPTPPGAVRELSIDFAAPKENCSVASIWQIQTLDGQPCYKSDCFLQVVVTVLGG